MLWKINFIKSVNYLFLFLLLFNVISFSPDLAQAEEGPLKGIVTGGLKNAGIAAKYIKKGAEPTSIEYIVAIIIETVLSFLGVVFLILMVYGGYLWMTAAGNEEKIKKGQSILTNAVIGLIIVLAAYAITYFVVSQLITGTKYGE